MNKILHHIAANALRLIQISLGGAQGQTPSEVQHLLKIPAALRASRYLQQALYDQANRSLIFTSDTLL